MKSIALILLLVILSVACNAPKQAQQKNTNEEVSATYTTENNLPEKENDADALPAEDPGQAIHVVQKGESLWLIAKKYGVTVKDIVGANNIENPSLIKINQELVIPGKK